MHNMVHVGLRMDFCYPRDQLRGIIPPWIYSNNNNNSEVLLCAIIHARPIYGVRNIKGLVVTLNGSIQNKRLLVWYKKNIMMQLALGISGHSGDWGKYFEVKLIYVITTPSQQGYLFTGMTPLFTSSSFNDDETNSIAMGAYIWGHIQPGLKISDFLRAKCHKV